MSLVENRKYIQKNTMKINSLAPEKFEILDMSFWNGF